ncbi:MAG: GAF domain-containing protein [Anaerolineae bacterium]|nr:GAF domain-containing protein [Anaerolineae bacterium]
MVDKNGTGYRLKEATQIAGSSWVVHLDRQVGKWKFVNSYKLTKPRTTNLVDYLSQSSVDSWLCGALGSRSSRSRAIIKEINIGCSRLFAFPIEGSTGVLLVGGDEQNGIAQRVWKLVASTLSEPEAGDPEVSPVVSDTLVSAMQEGVPYDLPAALDQMLASIALQVPCQGAWLAVRRGDVLEIQTHWRTPQSKGTALNIDNYEVLQEISKTQTGLRIERDAEHQWEELPQVGLKTTTGAWGCVPLVVGQRLIGMIALWRLRSFNDQEWKQFVDMVVRAAPSVEVIITFTELSGHLHRLAMLNDFVLTLSSGKNIDQIAQRVFALLARAFRTEVCGLYLISTDERTIREYRNVNGNVNLNITGLSNHPVIKLSNREQIRQLSRNEKTEVLFASENSQDLVLVPLRYRGRTNGWLALEISSSEGFSVYDTRLITVIAGHLAGLLEYTRLREEAIGRARNLGLIHEVVQEVIGLLDKQEVIQITAELLVRYFGYEFAVILLVDDDNKPIHCGSGGSQAPSTENLISEFAYLVDENKGGITHHVLDTGESLLVNDVTTSSIYISIEGWDAGSELCVPLKDGGRVVGLMDIESSSKNAFDQNDIMVLESLAGIISSVISNADQYQHSQENVRKLRQTQQELQSRIESQLEAERRLIQAEKLAAVGEMAAGIAHELNNPLTTVNGFTEIVLDEIPKDSKNRSDLELVLQEARRARDVVRRLLDFSRRSESERTKADINEILNDVLSLTNHLMQSSAVELDVSLEENLPWVSIDRNQMKQVFLNLIHNAIQAMPSGGQLLIKSATLLHEGRKWVTASVSDSGEGIVPEAQARIFEPFFTTKSNEGGTGLGLSITFGIVSDHGGDIEVFSKIRKGSKFIVRLPI